MSQSWRSFLNGMYVLVEVRQNQELKASPEIISGTPSIIRLEGSHDPPRAAKSDSMSRQRLLIFWRLAALGIKT